MGKQGALLSQVAPHAEDSAPPRKVCPLMDSMEWERSWSRNWPHCIAMCDKEVSGLTLNIKQPITSAHASFTYMLTYQFGNKVGLS